MKLRSAVRNFSAVAVACAMVVSLSACGAKDVSGDYTTNVTLADIAGDEISELEEQGLDFMGDANIEFDLTMDDKNFTLTMNTSNLEDEFNTLIDEHSDELKEAVLSSAGLSDMSDEELDTVAQFQGYDTFDAFMSEVMSEAMSEAIKEIEDESDDYTVSGTYKVSGNTVNLVVQDGSSLSVEAATIGDDGSISLPVKDDDIDVTLVFQKSQA